MCDLNYWWNDDPSIEGLILILALEPRAYSLSATMIFDGATRASEIRLVGNGTTSLQAPNALNSTLVTMLPGAPPLTIQGVALGGRMDVRGASLTLDACSLEGHRSISHGGAISVREGGRLAAHGTTLRHNRAADSGGAIAIDSSSAVLYGCHVTNNWAGNDGGAIHAYNSSLILGAKTLLRSNLADGGRGTQFSQPAALSSTTFPHPSVVTLIPLQARTPA